jgi:hypothetical protein
MSQRPKLHSERPACLLHIALRPINEPHAVNLKSESSSTNDGTLVTAVSVRAAKPFSAKRCEMKVKKLLLGATLVLATGLLAASPAS